MKTMGCAVEYFCLSFKSNHKGRTMTTAVPESFQIISETKVYNRDFYSFKLSIAEKDVIDWCIQSDEDYSIEAIQIRKILFSREVTWDKSQTKIVLHCLNKCMNIFQGTKDVHSKMMEQM